MSADKNNDRILKPSGRIVASLPEPVEIKLHTRCPHKWVIVDMESGELWGHDGQHFHRLLDELLTTPDDQLNDFFARLAASTSR